LPAIRPLEFCPIVGSVPSVNDTAIIRVSLRKLDIIMAVGSKVKGKWNNN